MEAHLRAIVRLLARIVEQVPCYRLSCTMDPEAADTALAGLIPLLIGFLYAVSDEIHQHFVPGRAMQARDVLIDTAGVLLGIWIARGIIRRY